MYLYSNSKISILYNANKTNGQLQQQQWNKIKITIITQSRLFK